MKTTTNYIKISWGRLDELVFFDDRDANETIEAMGRAREVEAAFRAQVTPSTPQIIRMCTWKRVPSMRVELPVVGEISNWVTVP